MMMMPYAAYRRVAANIRPVARRISAIPETMLTVECHGIYGGMIPS